MTCLFRTFLIKYCQSLTSQKTTSLKKFFHAAETDCPRAIEPLLLLAILDCRLDYLLRQARNTETYEEYDKFITGWHKSQQPLEKYLRTLPSDNRFRRPLSAWESESSQLEKDRKVLKQVSDSFNSVLDQKQLSRAEACRITNLNKGNFYAFLKGDTTKLSRNTATKAYRKILEYKMTT